MIKNDVLFLKTIFEIKFWLCWTWNTNQFSAASRPCRSASATEAVSGHEPLIRPRGVRGLRGRRGGPGGTRPPRPTKATPAVARGQMSHCWFHRIPRGNAGLCPQREKTLAGNPKPTRIPHFDTKNRNTWLWIRGTAHFIFYLCYYYFFFLKYCRFYFVSDFFAIN